MSVSTPLCEHHSTSELGLMMRRKSTSCYGIYSFQLPFQPVDVDVVLEDRWVESRIRYRLLALAFPVVIVIVFLFI